MVFFVLVFDFTNVMFTSDVYWVQYSCPAKSIQLRRVVIPVAVQKITYIHRFFNIIYSMSFPDVKGISCVQK